MNSPVIIDGESLTIEDLVAVSMGRKKAVVSSDPELLSMVKESRRFLLGSGIVGYGIRTGFGGNVKIIIPDRNLLELQKMLINSLKAGAGKELEPKIVRAAMLLRANSLIKKGCSGIRLMIIRMIVRLVNLDVLPLVPCFGSVGASGDLIPSDYISFMLRGKGWVRCKGKLRTTCSVFREYKIKPVIFGPKEGLSSVNGTSFSTAIAAFAVDDAKYLVKILLVCEAIATEAMAAMTSHLDRFVQEVKNHPGQKKAAAALRALIAGSKLTQNLAHLREKTKSTLDSSATTPTVTANALQDDYSIRAAPQIVGPVLETIDLVTRWIVNESNSGNDNPIIDIKRRQIPHTANFMASYPALGMDFLRLAVQSAAEMMYAVKEQLLNPQCNNGLPASLTGGTPGIHSGMKPFGLCATDIFNDLTFEAMPYTIHRRPTELPNQVWVSLGFGSGRHSLRFNMDLILMLANMLAMVVQAADLRSGRDPSKLAPKTRKIYYLVRSKAAFLKRDRPLDTDAAKIALMILNKEFNLNSIKI